MTNIKIEQVEIDPLVNFIALMVREASDSSNYQFPGLVELGVKLSTQHSLLNGTFNKGETCMLSSLLSRHADEIWKKNAPQYRQALQWAWALPVKKSRDYCIPKKLQREMVHETEIILPQILDLLEVTFSDLMPSPPWVPGLKLSFSDDRKHSTQGWSKKGFYANGGISLSLYSTVNWMGVTKPLFIEPSSYALDKTIGTFSVPHWRFSVHGTVIKSMAKLAAIHAFKVGGDDLYRDLEGVGFKSIYAELRKKLLNSRLKAAGGKIGFGKGNILLRPSGK